MNFSNEILDLKQNPLLLTGFSETEVEVNGIRYPGPIIINNDEVISWLKDFLMGIWWFLKSKTKRF